MACPRNFAMLWIIITGEVGEWVDGYAVCSSREDLMCCVCQQKSDYLVKSRFFFCPLSLTAALVSIQSRQQPSMYIGENTGQQYGHC